ncbi:MAG: transglycosylase SLT domain-containing protein [Xanthobacteraceae bacterium]
MSFWRQIRLLTSLAAAGMLLLAPAADAANGTPTPRPRPGAKATTPAASKSATAPAPSKSRTAAPAARKTTAAVPFAFASTAATSSADLSAVKEAFTAARARRTSDATEIQRTIGDPLARKLVEWAILRGDDGEVDFSRYVAFINENPMWPSIGLLRRRAEANLWQERLDPATVRGYFGKNRPLSAKGKFALARAMLLQGDRAGAAGLVRDAWRNDNFSSELEGQALDVFRDLISSADHKARMDMRLYAEDIDGGLRAANRAGGHAQAIAKARVAVIKKANNAKALLDAVPADARRDVGYIFSRIQFLRRADKIKEASDLMLSVPSDHRQAIDGDQWWIERRLIARSLLDDGDAKTAYRIAREAALPDRENYRAESQFTAGWIALRFLNDPATALPHFAKIGQAINNPIALARSGYWQGRAAEALGRKDEARAHYEAAARYSTAYYGQIARGRLGLKDLPVRAPPAPSPKHLEVARAIEILYAIEQRDLVAGIAADLGGHASDPAGLAALGDVMARNRDARAMLLLGKGALANGFPLEHYAFPTIGLPDYKPIGPAIEPAVAYAIARQESTFNQRTVSSAKAMGLMQVTPAAGKYIARKFKARYDERRLLSDEVYNVQFGTAELGDLIEDYRGSYILTFAGYNAGRGRVKQWIARFGDPRDPKVDPIDWVERIPFSETRNYVQRVLENLQVYRVRFGGGSKLLIEADLHRGAARN